MTKGHCPGTEVVGGGPPDAAEKSARTVTTSASVSTAPAHMSPTAARTAVGLGTLAGFRAGVSDWALTGPVTSG